MTAGNFLMLHAFSDLSRTRTLCFLCFLKQYFRYVGHVKGKVDYSGNRKRVIEALLRDVSPTYIIACLYDLVYILAPSGENPRCFFMEVLSCLAKLNPTFAHDYEGRRLAVHLFSNLILSRSFPENEPLLVDLAKIFEFKLEELREELQEVVLDSENLEKLKAFILKLIRSRRFCTASAVIKLFGCSCEEFLEPLIDARQEQFAEEWATSDVTENDMISSLVRRYRNRNMLKVALNTVYKYNVSSEFLVTLYEYKESQMIKLAEKQRWDQALFMAKKKYKNDKNDDVPTRLFQRLQKLARDTTGAELDELCEQGETDSLKLQDIGFSEENDVIMINTKSGLGQALSHFSEDKVDVIGIDSEFMNGGRKVSILQIATSEKVYIFDMINLFNAEPGALDECLKAVFHSARILKLGYAFHHDLKLLSKSYGEMECFHYCEAPTLDLQDVFQSVQGGLSGLAKTVLGSNLNKSMQLSEWGKRPLSNSQLHYAALDAAVLIPIYKKECEKPSLSSSAESTGKHMETLEEPSSSSSVGSTAKQIETSDWKDHIRSCRIILK